jgi:hypothetical protein
MLETLAITNNIKTNPPNPTSQQIAVVEHAAIKEITCVG